MVKEVCLAGVQTHEKHSASQPSLLLTPAAEALSTNSHNSNREAFCLSLFIYVYGSQLHYLYKKLKTMGADDHDVLFL